MKETDYPALYMAADTASQVNQRSFLFALAGNLLCLGVAAALSVINYAAIWFGVLQAFCCLVASLLPFFSLRESLSDFGMARGL